MGLGLTLFFVWLSVPLLYLIFGALTLFVIYFFRDPVRIRSCSDREILSPADGRVLRVDSLEDSDNPLGQPAVKISIFMSLFDVHVNRIPAAGAIQQTTYHPGKFFSADLDKASEHNESNRIALITPNAMPVVFVQIAGLIARRIACWVKEGDEVKAGQRFGLIRFGSRVDVYLPAGSQALVQKDHRVKAGLTVLGVLP